MLKNLVEPLPAKFTATSSTVMVRMKVVGSRRERCSEDMFQG